MPAETDLMALISGAEPVVAKAAVTLVAMQRAPRNNADLAVEKVVIDGRITTIAGTDSRFDDLQKIASKGHIHDELLRLFQEIAL